MGPAPGRVSRGSPGAGPIFERAERSQLGLRRTKQIIPVVPATHPMKMGVCTQLSQRISKEADSGESPDTKKVGQSHTAWYKGTLPCPASLLNGNH